MRWYKISGRLCDGPFDLDYRPPCTTSNYAVFEVSFPSAINGTIALWKISGEAIFDPVINEAMQALQVRASPLNSTDAIAVFKANKDLLTLHEHFGHPARPKVARTAPRENVWPLKYLNDFETRSST